MGSLLCMSLRHRNLDPRGALPPSVKAGLEAPWCGMWSTTAYWTVMAIRGRSRPLTPIKLPRSLGNTDSPGSIPFPVEAQLSRRGTHHSVVVGLWRWLRPFLVPSAAPSVSVARPRQTRGVVAISQRSARHAVSHWRHQQRRHDRPSETARLPRWARTSRCRPAPTVVEPARGKSSSPLASSTRARTSGTTRIKRRRHGA